MIENVLRAIGGIAVYDAISICLFMLVFGGAIVRAVRMKKSYVNAVSVLPLEDGERPRKGAPDHE